MCICVVSSLLPISEKGEEDIDIVPSYDKVSDRSSFYEQVNGPNPVYQQYNRKGVDGIPINMMTPKQHHTETVENTLFDAEGVTDLEEEPVTVPISKPPTDGMTGDVSPVYAVPKKGAKASTSITSGFLHTCEDADVVPVSSYLEVEDVDPDEHKAATGHDMSIFVSKFDNKADPGTEGDISASMDNDSDDVVTVTTAGMSARQQVFRADSILSTTSEDRDLLNTDKKLKGRPKISHSKPKHFGNVNVAAKNTPSPKPKRANLPKQAPTADGKDTNMAATQQKIEVARSESVSSTTSDNRNLIDTDVKVKDHSKVSHSVPKFLSNISAAIKSTPSPKFKRRVKPPTADSKMTQSVAKDISKTARDTASAVESKADSKMTQSVAKDISKTARDTASAVESKAVSKMTQSVAKDISKTARDTASAVESKAVSKMTQSVAKDISKTARDTASAVESKAVSKMTQSVAKDISKTARDTASAVESKAVSKMTQSVAKDISKTARDTASAVESKMTQSVTKEHFDKHDYKQVTSQVTQIKPQQNFKPTVPHKLPIDHKFPHKASPKLNARHSNQPTAPSPKLSKSKVAPTTGAYLNTSHPTQTNPLAQLRSKSSPRVKPRSLVQQPDTKPANSTMATHQVTKQQLPVPEPTREMKRSSIATDNPVTNDVTDKAAADEKRRHTVCDLSYKERRDKDMDELDQSLKDLDDFITTI